MGRQFQMKAHLLFTGRVGIIPGLAFALACAADGTTGPAAGGENPPGPETAVVSLSTAAKTARVLRAPTRGSRSA